MGKGVGKKSAGLLLLRLFLCASLIAPLSPELFPRSPKTAAAMALSQATAPQVANPANVQRGSDFPQYSPSALATISVTYRAHVAGQGWLPWVFDGATAGTTGEARQMEAVEIKLVNAPPGVQVCYSAHVATVGWQAWVCDGATAGTTGRGLQMEALQIQLRNAPAGTRVQYRAHVAVKGWLPWVFDGAVAGTTGEARPMEAVQIQIPPVSARIDSYSPNALVKVSVGSSTTLGVTFTNTGNSGWNFIAGSTVWDSSGNQVANYSRTLSTPLQPNQQTTVSWSHTVNQTGDYWLQFAVWKATLYTAENLLDKKPSLSQKLITVNRPPNQPTMLSQFRSDGASGIPLGGTTNESTVILKGGISDPDGDQVKLQIELRRLDEYGGSFTGTPTHESGWLSSGAQASITAFGLANGNYHWRGRTMDTSGAASPWLSAGNNPDSAVDFAVLVGSEPKVNSSVRIAQSPPYYVGQAITA